MKGELITVGSQGLGRKHRFEDECVIGRHPDCDLQIIDSQISKQHVRVFTKGDSFVAEDLGSLNGVFVNARRIKDRMLLRPNDILSIGSQSFLFNPSLQVLPQADGQRAVLLLDDETRPVVAREVTSKGPAGLPGDFLVDALALIAKEEDPLAALLTRLGKLIRFDAAAVLRVEDRKVTDLLAIQSRARTLTISRTIAELVVSERKGIRVPDAIGDSAFRGGKSVARSKLRSVLAAPLWLVGRTVGVVFLTSNQPDFYSDSDLDSLGQFGPLLALAVQQQQRRLTWERRLVAREVERFAPCPILGSSPATLQLNREIDKMGPTPSAVLVVGETGTGKELVARRLHELGPGPSHAFVAVNCGAIPDDLVESEFFGHEKGAFSGAHRQKPGKLEIASGGTLFLDEIGDLKLPMQVKMLRALEQKSFYRLGGVKPIQVDFRLVAATHRNLEEMCAQGTFRQDLYYRIHVLGVRVEPLRERTEDVELLARYFLEGFAKETGKDIQGIDSRVVKALEAYRWPGNVRELRNIMERMVVQCDQPVLGLAHLPVELLGPEPSADGSEPSPLADQVRRLERQMIVDAMRKARGKKVAAAKILGISRPTLDKKLAQLDIDLFEVSP